MAISAERLAARVSAETGLEFHGTSGRTAEGLQLYQLQPAHHPPAHTFTIQVRVGWRNVEISFRPGNFSGDLMRAMSSTDAGGRAAFVSVLESSERGGAQIAISINGRDRIIGDPSIWEVPWHNMTLDMRKGMMPINDGDDSSDEELIGAWVGRLSAAVLALLPLEADEALEHSNPAETVVGLPEGAKITVVVNRYERDRRNRAAALAIHGCVCKACAGDMRTRYGLAGSGLIEIHHVTPVSELGENYIVDPRTDLVPLCPNCHAIAHRRSPPYAVDEIKLMLQGAVSASIP